MLTEHEALVSLLQLDQRLNELNAFNRVRLALDLDSGFREIAKENQRTGGLKKGSSNLTTVKKIDVREEIARVAGVCTGQVSKVKELLRYGSPKILTAVERSDLSIHRASLWCKLSFKQQIDALEEYESNKNITQVARRLVSKHRLRRSTVNDFNSVFDLTDPDGLVGRLSAYALSRQQKIKVVLIDSPGSVIFLTKDLSNTLATQKDWSPQ